MAPAKHYDDYAKFELAQPPLVFSLVPNAPAASGSLSHLGFPVASTAEVEAAAKRLNEAGLNVSCQNGTTCGYATQDKVWVADPDNNYWEIYVVHQDVDPADVRRGFDGTSPLAEKSENVEVRPIVWEHRVTEGMIDQIPHEDHTVDDVRLTGTFNSSLNLQDREHLLAETRRVLKPGGRLSVHGLVASAELHDESPSLPGVAALVKRVPLEAEPLNELAAAGFVSLQITKLTNQPAFQQGQVEMREMKIAARSPVHAVAEQPPRMAVYKGPFEEAVDDSGVRFQRGKRTEISLEQWQQLALSAAAEQFLFIDGDSNHVCNTNGSFEHAN